MPDEDLFKILNERGIQLKSFDELKSTLSERESTQSEVKARKKQNSQMTRQRLYEFAISIEMSYRRPKFWI